MTIDEITLIRIWEAGPDILPLEMDGRNSSALVIGVPKPGTFKKATIIYPDKTYRVDENAVFFHKKDDYYISKSDSNYTRCLVINFNGNGLPEHFCVPDCADLRKSFENIYSIWLRRRYYEYYELDCIGLTMQLMAEVLRRRDSTVITSSVRLRLLPALEYIHDNYISPELRISDIAAHCKISERYLCKLFKDDMGASPKEYITGLRLKYAKELLAKSVLSEGYNDSIESIAQQTGFTDGNYFSAAFHEKTGVSPSEYRKKFSNFNDVNDSEDV